MAIFFCWFFRSCKILKSPLHSWFLAQHRGRTFPKMAGWDRELHSLNSFYLLQILQNDYSKVKSEIDCHNLQVVVDSHPLLMRSCANCPTFSIFMWPCRFRCSKHMSKCEGHCCYCRPRIRPHLGCAAVFRINTAFIGHSRDSRRCLIFLSRIRTMADTCCPTWFISCFWHILMKCHIL